MNWPAYPKYKDSGVQWLGKIPADWVPTRMDKHLRFVKDQVSVEELAGQEVFHYSIPNVQSRGTGDVEDGDSIDSNKLRIVNKVVLVSKLNPRKGTVCIAAPQEQITVCSTEFIPLKPHGLDLNFLFYLVSCDLYRQRLESAVSSVTRSHQRIDPTEAYRFWWGLPGFGDQVSIADFLDRETAKIDALIAKQEQLIATLREDRATTITHAVTKGLDPNVEMKDSGIEWLGEIPAHWDSIRLKRTLLEPLKYGINAAADEDDPENPRFVRITDIDSDGGLKEDTFRSLPIEIASSYMLRDGDILFARSGATVGKSFEYQSSWGRCCFAGYLIRARVDPRVIQSHFLSYYALSSPYWSHIFGEQIQTTIQNVNAERYSELPVPLPPSVNRGRFAGS